jgi:hypothetical protein
MNSHVVSSKTAADVRYGCARTNIPRCEALRTRTELILRAF